MICSPSNLSWWDSVTGRIASQPRLGNRALSPIPLRWTEPDPPRKKALVGGQDAASSALPTAGLGPGPVELRLHQLFLDFYLSWMSSISPISGHRSPRPRRCCVRRPHVWVARRRYHVWVHGLLFWWVVVYETTAKCVGAYSYYRRVPLLYRNRALAYCSTREVGKVVDSAHGGFRQGRP